eukprot:CAMPEP_0201917940 /NCGR_PEP_ID=MMETSP0903-20130614/7208_1 /ASSEMBLY_ACC=CAM_ASM_000552 /TAXON_ID=420261 /ORGANISM="Thalassiosira antarctica, Strain CCMP982" /LENGTH=784 /DNA_ID=CAMNT_0048454113 /DNA_START=1 /DNA_END=2355 /DNA_ORIENTATION=+
MSCQQTSTTGNGYQYSHDETATIRLYPSSKATTDNAGTPPWSLNSRVSIESSSTFQSSTPLFHRNANESWNISEGAVAAGTPFSKQVLELLSRYPLQRLLIRVGDAATSSSSGSENSNHDTIGGDTIDEQQFLQEERARGPSGTSVLASFVQPAATQQSHGDNEQAKEYYQDQYASLLRYLLDDNLFPPCGAPLDSLRVRKHGHSTIVHSPHDEIKSTIQTVNVESFLAADAAIFCNPGIHSFLLSKGDKAGEEGGWGAAANNGACHSSDTWGLFGSLFSSSSGVTLSELLLGASMDATPWESSGRGGGTNKRNSVWVDLQVSSSCFVAAGDSNGGEECSVKVTRGASYRIALPSPTRRSSNDESKNNERQVEEQAHALNLSLGDLLLGHTTLEHSLSSEEEGWKAWYPCPLSDSSRIVMHLPTGYVSTPKNGIAKISNDLDGDTHTGMMEFDVFAWKDGYVDLAAPWAQLYPVNVNANDDKYTPATSSSLFGISRTVQRPLGVSSSGTLVSVLRYDQLKSSESKQSQVVKVQSLDILPGTLIKPRIHTLRMILYHGGDAGGNRFVPPINPDDQLCECLYNETDKSNSHDTSSDQCGLICRSQISLSELQHHKITLHSDGTMLLERTVHLHPDSSLWMMLDFDEAYLPFQKFPADANRGVDVFPSRASFTPVLPSSITLPMAAMPSITLYSPSLLVLPPVPDMSMPFNVISLSCTLWAFILGSLLNILVRRGTESIKREFTGEKEKKPLDKLKDKIKEKSRRLKEKLRGMKKKFEKKKVGGQIK